MEDQCSVIPKHTKGSTLVLHITKGRMTTKSKSQQTGLITFSSLFPSTPPKPGAAAGVQLRPQARRQPVRPGACIRKGPGCLQSVGGPGS